MATDYQFDDNLDWLMETDFFSTQDGKAWTLGGGKMAPVAGTGGGGGRQRKGRTPTGKRAQDSPKRRTGKNVNQTASRKVAKILVQSVYPKGKEIGPTGGSKKACDGKVRANGAVVDWVAAGKLATRVHRGEGVSDEEWAACIKLASPEQLDLWYAEDHAVAANAVAGMNWGYVDGGVFNGGDGFVAVGGGYDAGVFDQTQGEVSPPAVQSTSASSNLGMEVGGMVVEGYGGDLRSVERHHGGGEAAVSMDLGMLGGEQMVMGVDGKPLPPWTNEMDVEAVRRDMVDPGWMPRLQPDDEMFKAFCL